MKAQDASSYPEQVRVLRAELAQSEGRLAAARALNHSLEATVQAMAEHLDFADAKAEELMAAHLGLQRSFNDLRAESERTKEILSQMGPLGMSVALYLGGAGQRFPKFARVIKAPIRAILAARGTLKAGHPPAG